MNLKEFLNNNKRIDKYTFGEFIAQRREELGLTQRELAVKLEISNTYMWDIEKGHRAPPAKLVNQLKEVLNISTNAVDKSEFEDLLYLSRGTCAPDLINYLISSKEVRLALRKAIDKNLTGEELLNLIEKQ
ncbi:MAG: helix-turn-helix transcriptional regulator [Clostridia bacterium]|nr:helix-turn-helix transcriptional regulator [Clostridia bacterium]